MTEEKKGGNDQSESAIENQSEIQWIAELQTANFWCVRICNRIKLKLNGLTHF